MFFRSLDRIGLLAGLAAMGVLAVGLVFGSRTLRDYDPALLTYTFGALFSAFAITYRYAVWLQRPPTRVYWRSGWRLLFRRGHFVSNLFFLARSAAVNMAAQRFIHRRSPRRWFAHFCFAWGTLIAAAVTFPLVFGWIHFESRPDDPEVFRVVLLGLTVDEFALASWKRWVMFNLLNISAVMVITGVALALHRRLKDPGSMARQQFGNDLIPLILLLAISITGLMLTFSMHALGGAGYMVLSLVHALTVTVTLIYLPFGKFFHIFQRPAQLSVALYRRYNESGRQADCRVCGDAFAAARHVHDLKKVLQEVGLDWRMNGEIDHYAEVCPRCRRRLVGFCQGQAMVRGAGMVVGAGAREVRQMTVEDFMENLNDQIPNPNKIPTSKSQPASAGI